MYLISVEIIELEEFVSYEIIQSICFVALLHIKVHDHGHKTMSPCRSPSFTGHLPPLSLSTAERKSECYEKTINSYS